MAKKGESDEKVQAGTGPETLGKNVPGEPDQREAAALVAGGDPGAIEGEGAELPPGEPADAAGQGAGVVSDADEQPAPVVPAGDPPAGEPDAQGTDHAAAGLAPDGEGHVDGGGDLAAGAPAAVMDAAVAQVATAADLDAIARRYPMPEDPAFEVAVDQYFAILYVARHLSTSRAEDEEKHSDHRMSDAVLGDIAAFVRKIGKRATADVIGQQLKILGHRASPDLSEPERIAFAAFAHVLVELDAFAAAEVERARKAAETKAEVAPLPVEETTLEPVDDHFDTWR